MRHQFGLGLVHGLDRRARQFELAAGLQRDRAATGDVVKPDDVAALHDRLPAEQKLHAVKQRADPARAFIRHGLMALQRERGFLVLGAEPEFGSRLHARGQPRDQFVARLQRRHIDLVTRHKNSEGGAIRPNAPCGRGRPGPPGPKKRAGNIISSDGYAVFDGQRRRLVTRAAEPVKQAAQLDGIGIGQFGADVFLDRGRIGEPHLLLQFAPGLGDLDELAALVALCIRAAPPAPRRPAGRSAARSNIAESASAFPARRGAVRRSARATIPATRRTRQAAGSRPFSAPVRPRRAPGSGSASGESRRLSPRWMVCASSSSP